MWAIPPQPPDQSSALPACPLPQPTHYVKLKENVIKIANVRTPDKFLSTTKSETKFKQSDEANKRTSLMKLYHPPNHVIILLFNYGPYEYDGIIAHRKTRMVPLADKLTRILKVKVAFQPTDLYDRLMIELDGYLVFVCKLTNLKFDSNCKDYTSKIAYLKCKDVVVALRKNWKALRFPPYDAYKLMTETLL